MENSNKEHKIKGLNLIAIDTETGKEYDSFQVIFFGEKAFGVINTRTTKVKILELRVID